MGLYSFIKEIFNTKIETSKDMVYKKQLEEFLYSDKPIPADIDIQILTPENVRERFKRTGR